MNIKPLYRLFTLIELLVVIAVIAILITVLLPALQRAKETARRIICASNQRQLSVAATNYANEYDDFLPHRSHGYAYHNIGMMYFEQPNSAMRVFMNQYCRIPVAIDKASYSGGEIKGYDNIGYCPSAKKFSDNSEKWWHTLDYGFPGFGKFGGAYSYRGSTRLSKISGSKQLGSYASGYITLMMDKTSMRPFAESNHKGQGGNVSIPDGSVQWEPKTKWTNMGWANGTNLYIPYEYYFQSEHAVGAVFHCMASPTGTSTLSVKSNALYLQLALGYRAP